MLRLLSLVGGAFVIFMLVLIDALDRLFGFIVAWLIPRGHEFRSLVSQASGEADEFGGGEPKSQARWALG
jgi:hypothetical protein